MVNMSFIRRFHCGQCVLYSEVPLWFIQIYIMYSYNCNKEPEGATTISELFCFVVVINTKIAYLLKCVGEQGVKGVPLI